MKRAVLLLFLAPSVFAQHQYIIPMLGRAAGIDADHYANATALNPTARTAHLRVTGVYPVYSTGDCAVQVPQELAPRSRATIAFAPGCADSQLAAVSIESDQPLSVESTITSYSQRSCVAIGDVQQLDAGTEWVPLGGEALAHGEFDDELGLRANLLLINPNAYGLRVRIAVERPEVGGSREEVLVVAPRTTLLHPLRAVPPPVSPDLVILTGHHEVLVGADGPFWAGVSSITTTGGNHFQEAVALEP